MPKTIEMENVVESKPKYCATMRDGESVYYATVAELVKNPLVAKFSRTDFSGWAVCGKMLMATYANGHEWLKIADCENLDGLKTWIQDGVGQVI